MLTLMVLTIGGFVLQAFLSTIATLLGVIPELPDIHSGMNLVFNNIYLLNDFLPITDLFLMMHVAVTLKVILWTWKVIMFGMDLFNTVRRTFTQLRV